jgi:chorismate synthase
VVVIEGLPAGMPLGAEYIDTQLKRRQQGYGRGGRMDIERDRVEILSGVRHGLTLGSPAALMIPNLDWENWRAVMAVDKPSSSSDEDTVTAPRPGHADLAGGMKYGVGDLRDILERASARETAARVAAGAVFMSFLSHFGVEVAALVEEIGGIKADLPEHPGEEVFLKAESSPFRCPDDRAEALFKSKVDETREKGDTLGGVFLVFARGVIPGLGSHVHWDRRLDSRLAAGLMSIPGIKGVEIGLGFRGAGFTGTGFHDEIVAMEEEDRPPWRFRRKTNRAGGVEGGISNGEDLSLRAFMKPIPTTMSPLETVDLKNGRPVLAHKERSDVCAVPSAAVAGQAMCAYVLAEAYLEKFGGDSLEEVRSSFDRYVSRIAEY